jgi:pantoate--beta-alanine ligase
MQEFEKQPLLKLEYFEIANETTLQSLQEINPNISCRAFIAVFAGNIRLIDNISL